MGAPAARANLEKDHWVFHYQGRDENFTPSLGIRGTPLILLSDFVARFKLEMLFDPLNFEVRLKNPRNHQSLRFHTDGVEVEGAKFKSQLSRRPEFVGAKLYVPLDFADRALRPLLTGQAPPPLPDLRDEVDVLIDAGHGGNDWGTHLPGAKEKDLTLVFAKRLATELKAQGVRVALSRDQDVFLTPAERTRLANRLKARLFLSLHLNSEPQKKASGFEVFVLSLKQDDQEGRSAVARENQMIPTDLGEADERALSELRAEANLEKSLEHGKVVAAVLKKHLPSFGRPIKMGPFYVLYGAEMPALLVELGFLTQPADRQRILSHEKTLAKDLALALATDLKGVATKP